MAIVLTLSGLATLSVAQAAAEPWVLVDTEKKIVAVMDDRGPLETYVDVAFGRRGAGTKLQRGDDKTPLGVFRVGWVSTKSRFDVFIGLDYPNLDYAERAYQEKRIDGVTYYLIRGALESGLTPPQDTPLGGYIGIHGLGAGDPRVHADFNWTSGCVAMNNEQIRRLAKWVHVGTRVEIR